MSKEIETILLPLAWLGKQPYCKGSAKWDVGGARKQKIGFDTRKELENGKTLAELSFDEKFEISTRKKALEKIKKYIE